MQDDILSSLQSGLEANQYGRLVRRLLRRMLYVIPLEEYPQESLAMQLEDDLQCGNNWLYVRTLIYCLAESNIFFQNDCSASLAQRFVSSVALAICESLIER
jgi:hypothetical protein